MAQTNPTLSSRETPLSRQLRQEMEGGLAASRDPDNAGLPDLTARTTTMYSLWYTRTCPECKHRFREDDRVRLCPKCAQAYHDDDQYSLYCWQKHFAPGQVCTKPRYDPIAEVEVPGCDYQWPGSLPDEGTSGSQNVQTARRLQQVTRQFLHGLENVWKPFGEEAVHEAQADEALIGHHCPWCRFQVRAGDRVVKCPCGKCDTYFHNDIFRHLTCWNDWNGTRGNDYCPTTGARIDTTAPATVSGDVYAHGALRPTTTH